MKYQPSYFNLHDA